MTKNIAIPDVLPDITKAIDLFVKWRDSPTTRRSGDPSDRRDHPVRLGREPVDQHGGHPFGEFTSWLLGVKADVDVLIGPLGEPLAKHRWRPHARAEEPHPVDLQRHLPLEQVQRHQLAKVSTGVLGWSGIGVSIVYVLAMGVLAACDKAPCPCAQVPPPVVKGRCLPEVFVGAEAVKQMCVFEGYTWTCTTLVVGSSVTSNCIRGPETKAEKP